MCKHIYNQERTYPKGTPFTYQLSWTDLDVYYYGVRYKKDCHPDDLWTKYFTSSNIVKKFKSENGEPNLIKIDYVFDTREEAREYEENYIRTNNCVYDSRWLNKCNGGKDFCVTEESIKKSANSKRGFQHSSESKLRMSEQRKGNIRINNGYIEKVITPEELQLYLDQGWIKKGLPKSKASIEKLSKRMKGNQYNLGHKHSDETKLKMSKKGKGRKQSLEHMQNKSNSRKGYSHSEETRLKISNSRKNKVNSNESNKKRSESLKNRICINNGLIEKRIKEEEFIIYQSLGYIKGKLSNK